jgi:hypothetical protein
MYLVLDNDASGKAEELLVKRTSPGLRLSTSADAVVAEGTRGITCTVKQMQLTRQPSLRNSRDSKLCCLEVAVEGHLRCQNGVILEQGAMPNADLASGASARSVCNFIETPQKVSREQRYSVTAKSITTIDTADKFALRARVHRLRDSSLRVKQ